MVRWLVAVIFALFPGAVFAQTSVPAYGTPAPGSNVSAPIATGRQHICPGYPITASENHSEGKTTLGYTITDKGTVTDVSVLVSSGHVDLDAASVLCVQGWLYNPAMLNGRPTATPWKAVVNWSIPVGSAGQDDISVPVWAHGGTACQGWHMGSGKPAHRVVMTFFVEPDGSTKDVTVSESSGNLDIDKDAVACLGQRTYIPAKQHGSPVEVHISDWLY